MKHTTIEHNVVNYHCKKKKNILDVNMVSQKDIYPQINVGVFRHITHDYMCTRVLHIVYTA